jgi:putative DNA primase/helicase
MSDATPLAAASPVAQIPDTIKKLPGWAVSVAEGDNKVPRHPSGRHANINDPATLVTFDEAVAAELPGKVGVALAIKPELNLVGLDLDDCRDAGNGEIHPEARKLIAMFGSYAEVSVSGTGLHALAWGAKPSMQRPWTKLSPACWPFEVELFDNHFLTITGNHLAGTPTEVLENNGGISLVYYHVAKVEADARPEPVRAPRPTRTTETPSAPSPKMTDDELLQKIGVSAQAAKFIKLMAGQIDDYAGDSEADLALAGVLAFWTQDPEQIERIMRKSALARDKWDSHPTYLVDLTIEKAIQNASATYGGTAVTPDFLGLVPLNTIDMKPVPWLWPGYLPRGATSLLVGDPGNGKTLSALDLLARITTGAAWPDGVANQFGPRNVIVLSAEDSPEYTIRPRIEAAGGDSARVFVIPSDKVGKLSLQTGVEQLRQAIVKFEPLAIVIDPLSAYLPGIDTYRDNEVRSSLMPFVALLDQYGVAAIAIVHMSKNIERNAMQRVLGSVAFTALSRSTYMVSRDPDAHGGEEARRLFLALKFNLGREPEGRAFKIGVQKVQGDGVEIEAPVAEWERDGVKADANTVLRQLQNPSDRRRETQAALLELLKDGPVLVKDVMDQLDLGKSALGRLRDKLHIESVKDPADPMRGPYYLLPPGWDTKAREAWTRDRMALRQPPADAA